MREGGTAPGTSLKPWRQPNSCSRPWSASGRQTPRPCRRRD